MPTDEEAQAGHRIILKAGVDSSARTDRNPRAPNHLKDKVRLADLAPQYADPAHVESDTVVRGETIWVTSLNAPFFWAAASTAPVDHVVVLSGPGGPGVPGRWLHGSLFIVLDPNCVVFTDAAGRLTDDPGSFTYTKSPGWPGASSLLVGGGVIGVNQGASGLFFATIGGHATGLRAAGAFSNFSPFDPVNGQLFFTIENFGGNISGMGWSIGGGIRAGQTVAFDGSMGFSAADWSASGGGGFSFYTDLLQTIRAAKIGVQGAHGSMTVDSLAGTGTRMVTASATGLLSTAAIPVAPPDVHLAHVDMDRDDTAIFPNGINRAAIGSGILKQTVATGVATLAIASSASDYQLPGGHVFTDRDQSSILPNQQNVGALASGILRVGVSGGVATAATSNPQVITARDESTTFPSQFNLATITQVVSSPVSPGLWPVFQVSGSSIIGAQFDAPTFRYAQMHSFNGNLFCGGLARGSLFLPLGMGPIDIDQNVPESDFDNWGMPVNLPGEYATHAIAIRGEAWINPTTGMGSPDNSLNGTCIVNITNNGAIIGSSTAYAAGGTGLKPVVAAPITSFSPWPIIAVSLSGTATTGFLRIRVNLIIEMLTH